MSSRALAESPRSLKHSAARASAPFEPGLLRPCESDGYAVGIGYKLGKRSPLAASGSPSVQPTTQLMKHLRCMDVAWSQLHGPLELPKRLPPAPLLEVDAP